MFSSPTKCVAKKEKEKEAQLKKQTSGQVDSIHYSRIYPSSLAEEFGGV
jgi:hypothetical protein